MSHPLVRAEGLKKSYRLGNTVVPALKGVDLAADAGEFVVVAGPSGSGKTTLFNLIGTLDEPDAGRLLFDGHEVARWPARERTLLRRRKLGFVFQSFNLVPVLSAFENVEFPLWLDGVGKAERRRRAMEALDAVGLAGRADHRPDNLSGGERQRVSLARALAHKPLLVLADEPTANLDSATGGAVLELLLNMNREQGTTFLVATHDPAIMARAPRVVRIHDGEVRGGSA